MIPKEALVAGLTIYRVATNFDDQVVIVARVVKSLALVFTTLVHPKHLDARGERVQHGHVCRSYSLTKRDALLAFIAERKAEIGSYRRKIMRAQNAVISATAVLQTLNPSPSENKP